MNSLEQYPIKTDYLKTAAGKQAFSAECCHNAMPGKRKFERRWKSLDERAWPF
jgi:hypothetical protein